MEKVFTLGAIEDTTNELSPNVITRILQERGYIVIGSSEEYPKGARFDVDGTPGAMGEIVALTTREDFLEEARNFGLPFPKPDMVYFYRAVFLD